MPMGFLENRREERNTATEKEKKGKYYYEKRDINGSKMTSRRRGGITKEGRRHSVWKRGWGD